MGWELLGSVVCMLLWAVWTINKKASRPPPCGGATSVTTGAEAVAVGGKHLTTELAPHESFASLAREHGPIMTLCLGSMSTVVISSEKVARDMFKNHDVVVAGRKTYEAMKEGFGTDGSIIMAQYRPEWRTLRRLCTTEFFVTSRLDATQALRSRCIDGMVQFIAAASATGTVATDVRRFFFLMTFNLIGNLMFSKDLFDPNSEIGGEFLFHTGKVLKLVAKPNFADFLPILRRFDPQGIRRKTQFHLEQVLEITGGFIRERMEARGSDCEEEEERSRDYMDVLLEHRGDGVEGPLCFSSASINATVLEMFIAGTDTTTSTLEWAMAELLHNPRTLQKLQAELRPVVKLNQKLEEKHLENLPYLKAVIRETLRLHPPFPFLVPHRAMDSLSMLGYHIPKETQILVNVRAIGRDPQIWKTPLEFRPERFLEPNINVDYMGHHFEFIPFGSGRRICPALPLASRVLSMALGSILLAFDWILEDGVEPSEMDMSEHMGATLKKAIPLKAVAIPYKG